MKKEGWTRRPTPTENMELPLTPLEFARRTRKLYSDRQAVIDGELRLTYAEFFDRCDRWSSALAALGITKGDRVAYIAPNTHAMLESFYAIPQLGAVLVPLNYRLIADDFVYLINHSGARVVCVHSDYLDVIESVRDQLPKVEAFVAAEDFLSDGNLHDTKCLILDVRLPGMSGLDLQRRLAAHHHIPIIFVSAHDQQKTREQALQAGAVAFLNKPFSEEALLSGVHFALQSPNELA